MSNYRSILGKAGADVTIYRLCKRNALVIDRAAAGTDEVLGVAGETAASGKQCSIIVEGLCEVDFNEAVAPGTKLSSDLFGRAVAATAAGGDLIIGEYCPEPVNGAVADSVAGERGRILLYSNKMTVKV